MRLPLLKQLTTAPVTAVRQSASRRFTPEQIGRSFRFGAGVERAATNKIHES